MEAVKSRGGVLELGDLSSHATARVDPICTTYRWATAVSGRAVASCRPSHAAVACPFGFMREWCTPQHTAYLTSKLGRRHEPKRAIRLAHYEAT